MCVYIHIYTHIIIYCTMIYYNMTHYIISYHITLHYITLHSSLLDLRRLLEALSGDLILLRLGDFKDNVWNILLTGPNSKKQHSYS